MKTNRIIIFMLAFILSAGWCVAKDLRTVVFKVEKLACENCEKKVKKNIRFEKGVKTIKTYLKNKLVAITYDAEKTNVETIQAGFRKFDYEAILTDEKPVE